MFKQRFLNWMTGLVLSGIVVVSVTVVYYFYAVDNFIPSETACEVSGTSGGGCLVSPSNPHRKLS